MKTLYCSFIVRSFFPQLHFACAEGRPHSRSPRHEPSDANLLEDKQRRSSLARPHHKATVYPQSSSIWRPSSHSDTHRPIPQALTSLPVHKKWKHDITLVCPVPRTRARLCTHTHAVMRVEFLHRGNMFICTRTHRWRISARVGWCGKHKFDSGVESWAEVGSYFCTLKMSLDSVPDSRLSVCSADISSSPTYILHQSPGAD